MKRLLLLLVVIFISCKDSNKTVEKKEKAVDDVHEVVRIERNEFKTFFIADKIDHYYLKISDNSLLNILKGDTIVKDQKKLSMILSGYYPDSISRPNFESDLIKYTFVKTELNKKKKREVEKIFTQKDSMQMTFSGCIPMYRDIFIFKKNDSITGIAKICFGCGVAYFYGTKVDTEGFGMKSELKKLEKIIR
ncbi:hypothetical protein GON26_05390 [Flavobacterium sp. GA093]|uniref:Lipoprotein n=1 Tax=Flavobacterium hydrocarbonoxydans TaxID=2683249 RepID=A0A6I4NRL8_9FLAO|nr:hypothetical protein [Flavobacterium hydrocarbonoxydans]MWB93784.1 hypothetical protein [Flavobacterium hydrocarbonoxydans]